MAEEKKTGVLAGVSIPADRESIVEEVAKVEKAISAGAGGFVEAAISALAGSDSKPIDSTAVKSAIDDLKGITAAAGNVLSGVSVDDSQAARLDDVAETEKKIAEGAASAIKEALGNVMGVD